MTMLKIMANENMAEWTMLPGVINETVAAAKKFLEERPEELVKVDFFQKKSQQGAMKDYGASITRFLGWSGNRVYEALASLRDQASGEVEREAVANLKKNKIGDITRP